MTGEKPHATTRSSLARPVTWHIDLRQMGVGGDDSWGARAHPPYMIPAQAPYAYEFLAPAPFPRRRRGSRRDGATASAGL